MRILHLEGGRRLYGGARQVLYLLDGLRERGVAGELAAPPESAIAAAAAERGHPLRPLELGGDHDAPAALRLRRLLERDPPDLLHVHSRRGADFWGGLAARIAGVPAVISRRVDNPEPRWLARLRYAPYARIVAISRAIAHVLEECGVDAGRVSVIRSALDASEFAGPRQREWLLETFSLPEEARVIGVVAQLIERKGHRHLFAALPEVRKTVPEAHLLVLGRGPLAGELRHRVIEQDLSAWVRFAGFREDLPRILPALDILAHPALAEGLGVALLQAQAAGVPVVACDTGGVSEAVAHGETGLLVPPGDSAALARALAHVLTDGELAAEFAAAGPPRIEREFSVDVMVERHVELYREIVAAREAHGSE